MMVNLEGPFLGIKAALPLMIESATRTPFGGSIVNMSSISGIIGTANLAGHTTAKGGLRLLSKCLAIDFGRKGYRIRVNSVHPGLIDTESAGALMQARVRSGLSKDLEDARAALLLNYPIGRMGRAEDVAGGVAYLASDDAAYVTGTELVIDGGMTAQ
jgi:3(or 17)beta-hydroxysteroid dehydrogenase